EQLLILYDEFGYALLHVHRDQGMFHEWPDHTGMHIKGQGCGRAALRQFLRSESIAQQAQAPAPQVFGDIESVKSCLAQEGIVLDRISRFTVMQGCTCRKILRQLPTALLQAYMLLSDLKVHVSPLLAGLAPCL